MTMAVNAAASAARRVFPWHGWCLAVTATGQDVDKWRAVVDNRAGPWRGVRKTLCSAGIAGGLAVGGRELCVDCHRRLPAAAGVAWGDVEKLSPPAAVKIPRQ